MTVPNTNADESVILPSLNKYNLTRLPMVKLQKRRSGDTADQVDRDRSVKIHC